MPPVFDTYASIRRLIEAGMPEPQAAAIVKEQVQLIADTLATKDDLKELGLTFDQLKADFRVMRTEMQAMESRITARLSGLMIALTAALAAVIKIF